MKGKRSNHWKGVAPPLHLGVVKKEAFGLLSTTVDQLTYISTVFTGIKGTLLTRVFGKIMLSAVY